MGTRFFSVLLVIPSKIFINQDSTNTNSFQSKYFFFLYKENTANLNSLINLRGWQQLMMVNVWAPEHVHAFLGFFSQKDNTQIILI